MDVAAETSEGCANLLSARRLALVSVLSLFAPLAATAESYKIVELPTRQLWGGRPNSELVEMRSLAWLDQSRLMFAGYTPGKYSGPSRLSAERIDPGIFIWDTESGQVTRVSDEVGFCYADGWGHFRSRTDGHTDGSGTTYLPELKVRFGPFGKEKTKICPHVKGQTYAKGCLVEIFALNMSCKAVEYERQKPPLPQWGFIRAQLRSGDGVILSQYGDHPANWEQARESLHLFSPRHPSGKALPITEREGINSVTYAAFERKYVVVGESQKDTRLGLLTTWPEGKPQPIYLMTPEGETEVIEVPKLPESAGIFIAQLTRAGLVYHGVHGRTGGGVFLYRPGGRHEALDRGKVGTITVTPDGCKVAWAIINNYGRGPWDSRIKYINFCGGDK